MAVFRAPRPDTARRGSPALAALTLALATTALVVVYRSIDGRAADLSLFAAGFLAFTAPGWPLARWVTGSGTSIGWRIPLALLLGYATSALAFLVLRLIHLGAPWQVLAAAVFLTLVLALALRGRTAGVLPLEAFTPADATAIGALCLVALAIVGPVFANVGRAVPDGVAYRAYFTADLFAHMSVVSELARNTTPTTNPYFPGEPLPYYWAYFAWPSLYAILRPGLTVDRGLLLNATTMALVYTACWFVVIRSLRASATAAAIALALTMTAASLEGAYFLWDHWTRGRDYWGFRVINVDGLTRWNWWLPPVDGFHRLFWYTPQHGMALTLGTVLLAVVVAASPAVRATSRGVLDGLLLGATFAASSFNGLLILAWYAASETVTVLLARFRALWAWVLARGIAAVIVLAVLALTIVLGMIQRDAGSLIYAWNRNLQKAPWRFLFLSFGPPLVISTFGIWPLARRHGRALLLLSLLVVECALILMFVEVPGHLNSYVPFRTGQLFLMVLAVLVAFAIDGARAWAAPLRAVFLSCIVVLWLAGLPTLVMDGYNAHDVGNREPGPGFPWTVVLSHDDVSALEWIRGHVADDARVQVDPAVRERASWAMIPVFARRHMATGTPLFLPNPERYKRRNDVVKRVYASADADEAWRAARSLGIEYLYVGALEREAQPAGVAKFLDHPGFRLVFQNASVNIFRIVDPATGR